MKKLLMILLALVLVTGLVAVTAAADPDPAVPGYTLYTVDLRGIDTFQGIADQYSSKKQELNGAWMYCESDQFRYVFVELDEGWEFDFDYPDEDTFGGDTTADFSPVYWKWGNDQNNAPLLGNRVMVLTLYGIDDLGGGGTIHYRPRVVNASNPGEDAILDIHLNVEYQLTFMHRYWNDYYPADLWLSPGQSEVIKIFKGRDDVSGSVKVVDEDLNEANGNANFPTLEKITSGEGGNGSEEEADDGWYRLTAEHCFSGYIMWTDSGSGETRLLSLVCALPEVGFYTDSKATDASYIRGKYIHKVNNQPIYLILNSGDEDATMRLDDCRQGDWITWTQKENGKVWMIDLDGTKFRDYDNIFANVTILYSNGREDGRRENINVLNALPGLRFCWPEWDGSGPHPRFELDYASQETCIAKGDGRALQLAWLDYDTETGEAVFTALTDDEIAQIGISENGNGKVELRAEEENRVLLTDIYVKDWTDGPVTFTHNGSSVYLYTELPEWGYYSEPAPSKETYLSAWVYDGTENTAEVYLTYYGDRTNVNIEDWYTDCPEDLDLRVEPTDRSDCLRLRVQHSGYGQYGIRINLWGESNNGERFDRQANLEVHDRTAALRCDYGHDSWYWSADFYGEVRERDLGAWYQDLGLINLSDGDFHLDDVDVTVPEQFKDLFRLERVSSGWRITALGYGEGYMEFTPDGGETVYKMPVTFRPRIGLKVQDANGRPGRDVTVTITPDADLQYSALALEVYYDTSVMTFKEATNEVETVTMVDTDEQIEAAIEAGSTALIYNRNNGRLIWMPAAEVNGEPQAYATAKKNVPIATLTFTIKEENELLDLADELDDQGNPIYVWYDEDDTEHERPHFNYGYYAYVFVDFYRGPDENGDGKPDGRDKEYSFVEYEDGRVDRLLVDFESGGVQILDHTPGDVNDDNTPDMIDVATMLRYHVGLFDGPDEPPYNWSALDVNGDGSRNLWDVTYLLRYFSGWEGYDKLY